MGMSMSMSLCAVIGVLLVSFHSMPYQNDECEMFVYMTQRQPLRTSVILFRSRCCLAFAICATQFRHSFPCLLYFKSLIGPIGLYAIFNKWPMT